MVLFINPNLASGDLCINVGIDSIAIPVENRICIMLFISHICYEGNLYRIHSNIGKIRETSCNPNNSTISNMCTLYGTADLVIFSTVTLLNLFLNENETEE